MGTIYRRNILKLVPAGAELFTKRGKRFARWTDRRGKTRTAEIHVTQVGGERIVIKSKYLAKYRDGENIVREVSTGCDDETAARSVLAELERRAELIRSKVLTVSESAVSTHAETPIGKHIDDYLQHLQSKGTTAKHRVNVNGRLRRLQRECELSILGDLKRPTLERWLTKQTERSTTKRAKGGMSSRTRNAHRDAAVSFAIWLVSESRLLTNPLAGIAKANEKADPQRQRRALTEAELRRLIHVARLRPLAELSRKPIATDADPTAPKRSNWKRSELTFEAIGDAAAEARRRLAKTPERIADLEASGVERALVYKSLALTGLRRNELASITVGQIHFDAPTPFVELHAADEKSRRGAEIPLQRDLAADLRDWIGAKLERLRDDCRRRIGRDGATALPIRLPSDTPLFNIPTSILRTLNRDLKAAGIPKVDERGRSVDIHALRHTFGTMLSKSGVAPRTAQAAMRHSSIDMTMNIYTDPRLLDVAGAIESLPELPLRTSPHRESQRATGTAGATDATGEGPRPFPPLFPPRRANSCISTAIDDKTPTRTGATDDTDPKRVSAVADKGKRPSSHDDNGRQNVGATRFELATFCTPCVMLGLDSNGHKATTPDIHTV